MYAIVPATSEHAAELARHMRFADRAEVWASHRASPSQAVASSLQASRDAYAGLAGERVLCLFGVATATVLSSTGAPWMLAAPTLRLHSRAFLRGSRQIVNGWRAEYDELVNYVDARNARAIRWLRWLGFEIEAAQPFGPDQLPFHRFSTGVLKCENSRTS